MSIALVWFDRNLRLADNPALEAASAAGAAVVPVYLDDPQAAGPWAAGGASRWWLHGALDALDASLRERGSRLIVRRGPTLQVLESLVDETGAATLFWGVRHEAWAVDLQTRCAHAMARRGVRAPGCASSLLHDPLALRTQAGDPFRVFTPFWKALRERVTVAPPTPAPARFAAPARWPASDGLDALGLRPRRPDWAGGLRAAWTPGEAAASARLESFAARAAQDYAERRDFPGVDGTSRLSAHLHFGEIHPRRIWHALLSARARSRRDASRHGVDAFLAEIAWREFSYHLLVNFPQLPHAPLRPAFAAFPWEHDEAALAAWQQGRTGYPLVDAGMRELWHTGWMHNRVRMVVASFLVKHLLLDWRAGARWFWDTLVDADLASNSASWQWVAGCGADAAPFFRIFNPVLQAEKFDPEGVYVRRWIPEIAALPDAALHAPWRAAPLERAAAGVVLGATYPEPIVEHGFARQRALRAFQEIG